jgi:hypothetical protein
MILPVIYKKPHRIGCSGNCPVPKMTCLFESHISYLVGGDWNHGNHGIYFMTCHIFSWEWKIIPSDELTPSFFRGVGGTNLKLLVEYQSLKHDIQF